MERRSPVSTKPWAVCQDMFPLAIGLVVEDRGTHLYLLYSENQKYPAECWDSKYVRRFDTPKQATDFYVVRSNETKEELTDLIQKAFSKTINNSI